MNSAQVPSWENAYSVMHGEWWAISEPARFESPGTGIARWSEQIDAMTSEMASLRSSGRWLGGPRTLLQALGLHNDELRLTAGLAWLLDPEGHHRLGDAVLTGFLERLEVRVTAFHPVRIIREEARPEARADLLLRLPGTTILVESKVWAGEQEEQCARLAAGWAAEDPVLVFLTRDGRPPLTAGTGTDAIPWQTLRWADIVAIVESALPGPAEERSAAPGVHDYLTTLREFHGGIST